MPFIKAAVMLPIMALFASQPLWRAIGSLKAPLARALVLIGLPVALLVYAYDKISAPLGRKNAAA
jgi:uncharacterized membrane protein YccF (DUF307 family)